MCQKIEVILCVYFSTIWCFYLYYTIMNIIVYLKYINTYALTSLCVQKLA